MGEKIRDIRPIKIGKTSLMVELNEGYSASQGRLIHIQNKKFRYLLTEHDFYHLSAMILRSWSEFSYIKDKKIEQKSEFDFQEREVVSDNTLKQVLHLSEVFDEKGIEYRVLDVQNKMVTIVVKESDIRTVQSYLGKHMKQYYHPFGIINQYRFLYQMNPFLMYKGQDDLFVEIYCQLPCASITPKTWIPLDRKIQTHLWDNNTIKEGVKWADVKCQFIFHLCWAIFHNFGFSPFSRSFIKENKECLEDMEMIEMLSLVFFNYTSDLVRYLKTEDFDSIIPNYYSFKNY